MKKVIKILIISFAIVSLFSILAFADDPIVDGIYDVQMESGFDIEFQDADKNDVTGQSDTAVGTGSYEFFPGAEQFDISFNATSGKYYMVFVLEDGVVPTVDNIVYIDQKTAEGSLLALHAYPSELSNGKTYNIYVSSNDGETNYTQVGSFKYYQAYTLGDVNEDGFINADDALLILKHAVNIITLESRQQLAADVNVKGGINADDALLILKYAVNIIDHF